MLIIKPGLLNERQVWYLCAMVSPARWFFYSMTSCFLWICLEDMARISFFFLLFNILGSTRLPKIIVSGSIQPSKTWEKKTYGWSWNQSPVLLLCKRLLHPLHHGSRAPCTLIFLYRTVSRMTTVCPSDQFFCPTCFDFFRSITVCQKIERKKKKKKTKVERNGASKNDWNGH